MRFEGGLCWMLTPVRARISISRGFSQMPWMKAVFAFMKPMRSRYSTMVEPWNSWPVTTCIRVSCTWIISGRSKSSAMRRTSIRKSSVQSCGAEERRHIGDAVGGEVARAGEAAHEIQQLRAEIAMRVTSSSASNSFGELLVDKRHGAEERAVEQSEYFVECVFAEIRCLVDGVGLADRVEDDATLLW